jgi:hypothetical protein
VAPETLPAATSALRYTLPCVPAPASWMAMVPKTLAAATSFLLSTLPRHVVGPHLDWGRRCAAQWRRGCSRAEQPPGGGDANQLYGHATSIPFSFTHVPLVRHRGWSSAWISVLRWAPPDPCLEIKSGGNHLLRGVLALASSTLVQRSRSCRGMPMMPLINITSVSKRINF